MIIGVNGINYRGAPGATQNLSFNPTSSVLSTTFNASGTPAQTRVLGRIPFDGQFLGSVTDMINVKAAFTQSRVVGDTIELKLLFGTVSLPVGSVAVGSTYSQLKELAYLQSTLSSPVISRSIFVWRAVSGVPDTVQVFSATTSQASDAGDLPASLNDVTIGSGKPASWFYIVGSNSTAGRSADTATLNYFIIEPQYAAKDVPRYTIYNQGIFSRNGISFSPATNEYTFQSNARGTAVTGTTFVTISASLRVRGGFTDGDLIRIESCVRKIGVAGTYTVYYYWNTSLSLTGAVQLAQRSILADRLSHFYTRRLKIIKADGTGSGTELVNTGSNIFSEYSQSAQINISNQPIDWTQDGYIICAVQPGNAADTVRCDYLTVFTYY